MKLLSLDGKDSEDENAGSPNVNELIKSTPARKENEKSKSKKSSIESTPMQTH